MTRIEVITIIYQHPKILLGMKKVRFGKGKYNGFGGGINEGESLEECAIRETFEEASIKIISPRKMGEVLFRFEDGEQDHLVHFFKAEKFSGIPKESDEMKPKWFDIKKIPYEKMWEDDKYWLPIFLENKKFEGYFQFDINRKIKKYNIEKII